MTARRREEEDAPSDTKRRYPNIGELVKGGQELLEDVALEEHGRRPLIVVVRPFRLKEVSNGPRRRRPGLSGPGR